MKYTIAKLKMMDGSDGVVFNCDILKNGIKVGTAHQGGYGGPNEYCFDSRAEQDEFLLAARCAYPKDKYEVEDSYLEDLMQDFEAIAADKRVTKWANKFMSECFRKGFKGDYWLFRRNGKVCYISPIKSGPTTADLMHKYKAHTSEKISFGAIIKADTTPRKTRDEVKAEIRSKFASPAESIKVVTEVPPCAPHAAEPKPKVDRSAAAKKAWITIRANRAAAKEAK